MSPKKKIKFHLIKKLYSNQPLKKPGKFYLNFQCNPEIKLKQVLREFWLVLSAVQPPQPVTTITITKQAL